MCLRKLLQAVIMHVLERIAGWLSQRVRAQLIELIVG
jgi:hypothetical protein